eukprot:CAMPEP_0182442724 /NCGR_PEP_ID=MMETSP1172-20130603/1625_1 /TAXON_ID=708627 /ORGANISM="Timspurckia oligopyrenoides, Strain CCMP3278" /LENGTH=428 /DNA_ID=CAMNT_0024637741 /DNA_START=44 /DNA_END=1330 /DNA_ORIENTATION=+
MVEEKSVGVSQNSMNNVPMVCPTCPSDKHLISTTHTNSHLLSCSGMNLFSEDISWSQLPEEILINILLQIPGSEAKLEMIPQFARVCKSWWIASRSESLWRELRDELWSSKVYVSQEIRDMQYAREAYKESLKDAKRTWLTKEELVAFEWSFRFKAAAGEHWTESDPWWQSPPAPVSAAEGESVSQQNPQGVSPSDLSEDAVEHRQNGRQAIVVRFGEDGSVLGRGQMHSSQQFRWRFVEQSCGRTAPLGSFVRVNQFPAYVVSRHAKNWAFIMESCWVVLCSFPMPPQGSDPLLEDENLSVTVDYQSMEAMAYNHRVTRFYFNDLAEGNSDEESEMEYEDDDDEDADVESRESGSAGSGTGGGHGLDRLFGDDDEDEDEDLEVDPRDLAIRGYDLGSMGGDDNEEEEYSLHAGLENELGNESIDEYD